MSYQVLARKWRPQNFKQMVGQEHVLKALIHALESQRLHHAYLFTGTRGVGKTTIGRILAKCLSCHKGITAEPCGTCGACESIAQGRYVDLIEIDAASRTKVEDMRELLDNVQYAASEGRFKIYLIDEVHMLSQSSFNALLKTLEEPPEHVKFLFATTDPQKLPVTILSRCLQFNLKNMPPERIVGHLQHILGEESVEAEEAALWALARAADGSMRDALSLTDQAIAYGNHVLTEVGVSAMLGTVDQKKIYRILDALIRQDAAGVLAEVKALADFAPDYTSVLASLIAILHRVAIEQAVPGATDNTMGDRDEVVNYARQLCAEDVQLFYQIALVSRKDLAITPDPQAGLEMALLRMMAFQLQPATGEKPVLESQTPVAVQPEVLASESPVSSIEAENVVPESLVPENIVPENTVPDSVVSESVVSENVVLENVNSESIEPEPAVEESMSAVPPEAEIPPIQSYGEPATYEQVTEAYQDNPMSVDLTHPSPSAEAVQTADPTIEESESKKKAFDELSNNHAQAPVSPQADNSIDANIAPPNEELTSPESINMAAAAPIDADSNAWPKQASELAVTGMTQNLLLNMALEVEGDSLKLYSDSGHFRLLNRSHEDRIVKAMKATFGESKKIVWMEGLKAGQETPMMWRDRRKAEMLAQAKVNIQADPNVQQLIEMFDARIVEESIQAIGELH